MPRHDGDTDDVRLWAEELAYARSLGEGTFRAFGGNRGYYRNTTNSHLIGKVGEVAVARWFEEHGYAVDRLFEEPGHEQECDLLCGGRRVEVKTWTAKYWASWGRCVAVGQVPALRKKADFIVWVTADVHESTALVVLQGWSSIEDVLASPVRWTGPAGKQVENHQLNESELRAISRLAQG